MSKVSLAGNASGTGIFTIASPNSNTDRTLTLPDNTGTLLTSAAQSIPKSALPTGSVLQVVQTVKSDLFTTSSSSYTDITGLSASITPINTSNKILVFASISCGASGNALFNLLRGSTALGQSTGAGENSTTTVGYPYAYSMLTIPIFFLDSPATTSSTTYKIQIKVDNSCRINARSTDGAYGGCSSITLLEISA
jgi:hypothetical protein